MLTAASSSSGSPTANTFRMPKKKHPQLQNSRDKEKNTTHSQLLPPVLNLQLQIHSECPKKKHPQLQNSRDKEKKRNTLPAASSSSESPTTNTFRMPKTKKHPQLQNSRDK
jgi:hypothetical protein